VPPEGSGLGKKLPMPIKYNSTMNKSLILSISVLLIIVINFSVILSGWYFISPKTFRTVASYAQAIEKYDDVISICAASQSDDATTATALEQFLVNAKKESAGAKQYLH